MKKPNDMIVHALDTIAGQVVMITQKLTLDQLHDAIEKYGATENVTVATYIGINHTGFFFSDDPNWNPSSPNAFKKPIGWIPWVQIHELLGNVPVNTTGDFMDNGGTVQ